jgi:hypothetical protein
MKFLRKGFLPILAILLCLPWNSNAGFWMKKQEAQAIQAPAPEAPSTIATADNSEETPAMADYTSATETITAVKEHKLSFFSKLQHKAAVFTKWFAPKRWFAILLSILNITVLFYLGWPRFYLGYKREGRWQLILTLLGLGGAALVYMAADSGSTAMFLPGAFLVALGLFSVVWQLVDAFRIWVNTLRPKRGYYRP